MLMNMEGQEVTCNKLRLPVTLPALEVAVLEPAAAVIKTQSANGL